MVKSQIFVSASCDLTGVEANDLVLYLNGRGCAMTDPVSQLVSLFDFIPLSPYLTMVLGTLQILPKLKIYIMINL